MTSARSAIALLQQVHLWKSDSTAIHDVKRALRKTVEIRTAVVVREF
jgi:hypothetical protein